MGYFPVTCPLHLKIESSDFQPLAFPSTQVLKLSSHIIRFLAIEKIHHAARRGLTSTHGLTN